MSQRVAAILTLTGFVIVLTLLVSFNSAVLNNSVAIVILAAFLVGSVVVLIRWLNSRRSGALFFGQQLPVLPMSWQRWILGEKHQAPQHRHQ